MRSQMHGYMFLHNVVMTSVMVLARFFLEGTLHFNSENPTHSVSFARRQTGERGGGGR